MKETAPWSAEQIETVRRLREDEGLTFAKIGLQLGRTTNSISNIYARRFIHPKTNPLAKPMPWTPERIDELRKLRDVEGLSFLEIAGRLNFSPTTLYKAYQRYIGGERGPASKSRTTKAIQRSTESLGPLWRDIDRAKAIERRLGLWGASKKKEVEAPCVPNNTV